MLTIDRQRRVDEGGISGEEPEDFRQVPFGLPDQLDFVVKGESKVIRLNRHVNAAREAQMSLATY